MKARNLKHRAVIEIETGQGLAHEPEMQELTRAYGTMTAEGKQRSVDYLRRADLEDKQRGGDTVSNIKLLTTKEAAAFLKLAPITLAKWRAQKRGPAWTRTGRTIKYHLRDLETYLKQNAVTN